ncbi:hypothetical protein CVT24_008537 [Panaeolus cyanescens]|uniref:HNH nuclease domain-containing protein n=1 Tax=Panaeolus cyanescens TaxID=181874 RepID=A0A409VL07_9AGAR|nr:hypothetical protein CVT24_008537 [Panaeolus cyanescens]
MPRLAIERYAYGDDEQTPSRRIVINKQSNSLESAPPSLLGDVKDASCYGDRCAVSRISKESAASENSHVVARKLTRLDGMMSEIEKHWHLGDGELNLDSRYNCFFVNPLLHRLFEKGHWLLLPSENMIDAYLNTDVDLSSPSSLWEGLQLTGTQYPEGRKLYSYEFFPLNYRVMKSVGFLTLNPDFFNMDESHELLPDVALEKEAYPYSDQLRNIPLHIHPHFAIVKIGWTLCTNPGWVALLPEDLSPERKLRLEFCKILFDRWSNQADLDIPLEIDHDPNTDDLLLATDPRTHGPEQESPGPRNRPQTPVTPTRRPSKRSRRDDMLG